MADFVQRVIGAIKLDVHTYEEVEADAEALPQAAIVVILGSLSAGVASAADGAWWGFFRGAVTALVGWVVWALLTWLIGTKLLPEPQTHADVGQLLRTIGFASAPGLLACLGAIPLLGIIVSPLVWIWSLAAFVIAVKQALDYRGYGRAIAVCVMGFAVYVVLMLFIPRLE